MKKYKIYYGLEGSFGGANFAGIYEFSSMEEATEYAYQQAAEEYESYCGSGGILSWDECREDLLESYPNENITDEDVDDQYQEEVERWVHYYAIEVGSPEDTEEEE